MTAPRYFIMRVTRYGPLVPARLQWLDHEPGVADNKLDRGPRSVFPFVDVAGEVVPPEQLLERFAWKQPHWKALAEVSQAEYEHLFARMRWAEVNDPGDPTLRPRQRVDPSTVALPSFEQENAG